ncbi:MAG: hypothetical protein KDK55_06975 [Chlamydiia bacterium]|nr:hypothetical protein [Chlamydiia bacterium]
MKHKSYFETQKKISKNDLLIAAEYGVISVDQVEKLWDTFAVNSSSVKPSRMLQFIYYFGTLLVISAMTWFMTLGWNWFSGGGLFLIAFCYGIAFFARRYNRKLCPGKIN